MTKLHCKVCNQLKTRVVKTIPDPVNGAAIPEFYPGSKNKKYVDENGRLWSGKICPNCQCNRSREGMRNLRFKQKLEKNEPSNDN